MYLGGWYVAGTLAALGVIGARELYRMAATQGLSPLDIPGSVAAALFPIAMYAALPAGQGLGTSWLFLGGAVWLMVVMLFALARGPEKRPHAAVGI